MDYAIDKIFVLSPVIICSSSRPNHELSLVDMVLLNVGIRLPSH